MKKLTCNFQYRKPCKNCPFRVDENGIKLPKDRIKDIADSLMQDDSNVFPCHITNLDENRKRNQHCFGAMKFLLNNGRINIAMRLAAMSGKISIKQIEEYSGPIAENIKELLDAHQ